jgi:uncharacterized protein YgiM (DUF1202 family)
MKTRILVLGVLLTVTTVARAGSVSYAQCGTYDSYILIYKSVERFEELGKLRCDEKVEVLNRWGGYSQIRTLEGRAGWVRDSDLSDAPPPAPRTSNFGLAEQPKVAQTNPDANRPVPPLTNEDVLNMNAMRHSPDLIRKKIAASRCAFDTSPEAFRVLKASGLSDLVILAMLQAPVASSASERKTAGTVEVKIPDGTPVAVELNGIVSADEAQEGAIVEMSAAEDLVVNGVPVILRGSPARARIVSVRQSGTHPGEVAWFMQDIVGVSGDPIPVNFAPKQPGKNRTRDFEGYPFFWLDFHKDSPPIKASDRHFLAVVHGDTVVRVSQTITAEQRPAPKTKTESIRQVSTQPVFPSQVVAPAPSSQPSEPPQPPALDDVTP